MKRLVWAFLLAGLLCLNGQFAYADTLIQLNNTAIGFESPLIKRENTWFIPVQEALPYFKAKLTYRRKEDIYVLSTGKVSLTFSPNTCDFILNHTQKFFRVPPFFKGTVLYLPLADWVEALDMTMEEKNSLLILSEKGPVHRSPETLEKEITQDTSSQLLIWGSQHYTLEDTLQQDGKLWANITDILAQEKYVLELKYLKLVFSKGGKTYAFPLQNSDSVFIKKNGKYYAYLPELFKALQLSLYPQAKEKTYTVLSPIQGIRSASLGGQIHILSSGPLSSEKTISLTKEKGFYIDIAQSEKQCSSSFQLSPPFSRAEVRSLNATTTRITLYMLEEKPYSGLIPSEQGGEIHSYATLQGLKELAPNIIRIKADQPILYSMSFFDRPHRLVLDIPDAISNLPLVTQTPKGTYYTRVRSSQFQMNPSITRIVFDLTETASFTIQKQGKNLDINFNITAPSANKTIAKVKPLARSLPLENHVIVIDPGHGGDDPGAISADNDYEKEFTLDISKRIQALLTEKGAYVVMCRQGDQNPSLEERTSLANNNKTDLFISVHINSFINPFTSGTETYYYKSQDKRLADILHAEIVNALNLPDKGVKKARLYVLRNSTMPATLIEPFFITHSHDLDMLKQADTRQKLAQAVVKGIFKYFRVKEEN